MVEGMGKRLRMAREAIGHRSCKAAAESIGMAQSTLHYYENEERYPGAEAIIWLCTGFSISADDLLGLESGR